MLGRMLRLAFEQNKLMRVPVLRKLKESAPRAVLRAHAVGGGAATAARRFAGGVRYTIM